VLVGPGLEADLAPAQALEARKDVGGDRLVGVADVRPARSDNGSRS
jgi:hypothetical protein